MLAGAAGRLRVEVADGDRTDAWTLAFERGDVTVSQGRGGAGGPDCVVRANASVLDALVSGESNAMAALLRGAVTFEGDPEVLVWFQRLLPGPQADE